MPASAVAVIDRGTGAKRLTFPLADHSKVAAGEYASESEVIRDGLRTLIARDRAVDAWLLQHVAPAYDAIKADPPRAVTAVDVRARMASMTRK